MPVKVVQLFQSYPLFFQPYIPPVVELLKQNTELDFRIMHYNGEGGKKVIKVPNSRTRQLKDKVNSIIYKGKSDYLERYCSKAEIEVLHLMDSYLFDKILNLLELPVDERPKIIMTMRGGETYVKPLVFDKWKEFYKDHANKIDGYIVMSRDQKDRLIQLGVVETSIHIIPISLKSSFKPVDKKKHTEVIRLVSMFRLVWEKNIDGNLRVVKYLKDQGYSVRYDLYGEGHMLGETLFLIHKYNIQDCVFMHGKLANEELLNRINSSDIYLQLSHSESLGMSVIEAQSLGLPAILANSGGLPETISIGKSGYCVDSWDAEGAAEYIIKLWKDPKLYQQFSKASIANCAAHFSNEVEVQSLTNLYKLLVLR